ncbi:iron ABC transporter permease [Mycoplasma enhydrae]|uniref:FecCD family ABC transporter permease n=1 Tax=Mycoplasma enhydrae TaxID=2499220 RepID=UPI0021E848DB|nr:iron ABC transporter permease [Mycoplasma enhydrae]MCV3733920.1 iron ABC transporter permease [Mycoplasma enhydrae]
MDNAQILINKKKKIRAIIFSITVLFSFFIIILSLLVGRYNVSLKNFFLVITNKINSQNYNDYVVIIKLRLPRTLIAFMVGGALTLSGLTYQETFKNNLVSPGILGVSSGSSVGAVIAIILGWSGIAWGIGISIMAFIFGIGTIFLTIFLSKVFRSKSNLSLILSGIIISSLMSSVVSLIKSFANEQTQLPTIVFWLLGSFSNAKIVNVYLFLPIYLVCVIFLLLIRWKINIIRLGFEQAQSKGINYKAYRWAIIITATFLTAASISIVGNISWIGLVIPNIIRLMLGNNTKITIPFSLTIGGSTTVLIDIFSRSLIESEIPISAISGILGATLLAVILIIQSKRRILYDQS